MLRRRRVADNVVEGKESCIMASDEGPVVHDRSCPFMNWEKLSSGCHFEIKRKNADSRTFISEREYCNWSLNIYDYTEVRYITVKNIIDYYTV